MHSRRLFLTICIPLVLTAMTQADDITENQQKLLKTFRGEFVKITPGKGKFPKSFEMGSDSATQSPVHKVTFDYSFSVAKYEVPQNLWEAVMGSNPSRWKGPRNSVEELSFADAESFCKKATQMMQQLNLIVINLHIILIVVLQKVLMKTIKEQYQISINRLSLTLIMNSFIPNLVTQNSKLETSKDL